MRFFREMLRALAVGLVLLLVLLGGLSAPAHAAQDGWTYDLAHELMSPFCPGRTLATCPSPQAAELIQWIEVQEASGASREEVVAVLVERYGEEIHATPAAEGIGLWAYVLPVAGFLVGGVVAVLVLRRIVGGGRRETPGASGPPALVPGPPGGEEDLGRQVDAELARRI